MSNKIKTVQAMAPKPHVVALDNPHGTNWRPVETALALPGDRKAGFSVTVEYLSDQGWKALYGYRHEDVMFTYYPDMFEPKLCRRGWHIFAN